MRDWKDTVYHLRVKTKEGTRTGTAFAVGPNLLATALHVVAKDFQKMKKPFRPSEMTIARSPQDEPIGSVQLLWPPLERVAKNEVDVAILEVVDGPTFEHWLGCDRPWKKGARFDSCGFPAAGYENDPLRVEIAGRLMDDDRNKLHADLEFDKAESIVDPEDWHGMSGAPVVIGSNAAVGVAIWKVTISSERLIAISFDAVREMAEGFPDLPPPIESELEEELLLYLEQSAAAQRLLVRHLRAEKSPRKELSTMDPRKALDAVYESHGDAHREWSRNATRDIVVAGRILLRVFGSILRHRFKPEFTVFADGRIQINCLTTFGAEVGVAAANCICPTFVLDGSANPIPRGAHAVSVSREFGIDPTKLGFDVAGPSPITRAIVRYIATKFGASGDAPYDLHLKFAKSGLCGEARRRSSGEAACYYILLTEEEWLAKGIDSVLTDLAAESLDMNFAQMKPGSMEDEGEFSVLMRHMLQHQHEMSSQT